MTVRGNEELSPSLLARKILCPAYVSAPLGGPTRFRFQALHALALITVIGRYLKSGYNLLAVGIGGRRYRIDLLFEEALSARKRLVEVKSSKKIREVHKIQAALYANKVAADEIVVSNCESDEILSLEFIQRIQERAKWTDQFLTDDPVRAASNYTPHPDVCSICANSMCPFLSTMPGFCGHHLTKLGAQMSYGPTAS